MAPLQWFFQRSQNRPANTNFTLCFLLVPKGLLNCQLSIRFLYVVYMTAFQNICAPLCVWAKRRVGLLFGIYLADDGENIVDVVHHIVRAEGGVHTGILHFGEL